MNYFSNLAIFFIFNKYYYLNYSDNTSDNLTGV